MSTSPAGLTVPSAPSPRPATIPIARLAAYGGRASVDPARITRWPAPGPRHISALIEVVHSGRFHRVNHPIVSTLEAEFSAWTKQFSVRAVGSGTAAIHIALDHHRNGGRKVLTPALNWPGALGPIHFAGLEPLFVDVDPEDASIDENDALSKLSGDVGIVLVTHLFGNVSPAPRLRAKARSLGHVAIVDDCAQAIGATRRHPFATPIETDAVIVSGNGAKHLAAGELGLLCGADGALIDHVDRVSLTSSSRTGGRVFSPMSYGLNYRPNVFSCAIALSRLPSLDDQLRARAENAALLQAGLAELAGLRPLHRFADPRDSFLCFALRLEPEKLDLPQTAATRDFVVDLLLKEGVPAWVWLRRPAWDYLPFWSSKWRLEDFPNTKTILDTMFYIVELAPPNGGELMEGYIEAFHKVWHALPALRDQIHRGGDLPC